MKKPDLKGGLAKSLYSFDGNETDSKLGNPTDNYNLFGPPSLIEGEELDDARQVAEAAYQHGYEDAMKMNRSGRLVEDDPVLEMYRKRVEQIRKEKIKKGRIQPVNKKERGWAYE